MNDYNLTPDSLKLAKIISVEVWQKYDDTHGYRTEKLEANNAVSTDNPDNIWFFWNQFDHRNQEEFAQRLINNYAGDPGSTELMAFCAGELARTKQSLKELSDMGIDL